MERTRTSSRNSLTTHHLLPTSKGRVPQHPRVPFFVPCCCKCRPSDGNAANVETCFRHQTITGEFFIPREDKTRDHVRTVHRFSKIWTRTIRTRTLRTRRPSRPPSLQQPRCPQGRTRNHVCHRPFVIHRLPSITLFIRAPCPRLSESLNSLQCDSCGHALLQRSRHAY
jgi:hypothetical protein